MRVVVPGLLVVMVLGCGGFDQLLSQSFEEGFIPACIDEHAPRVADLADPQAACECAKSSIEAETADAMERFTVLADPDRMQQILIDCNTKTGGGAGEPEPTAVEEPVDVEAPADPQ